MFQSLFRRAEVAIEHTVGQIALRALVAVLFVIAAGFGAAALFLRLSREFGPETASFVMAGAFALIGLIATIAVGSQRLKSPATSMPTSDSVTSERSDNPEASGLSNAERELLFSALTSVAPFTLPQVARLLLRNLPLLVVIGLIIFVLSRPSLPVQPMAAE